MAVQILRHINFALNKFEQMIACALFRQFPPPDQFCLAEVAPLDEIDKPKPFSLEDIIGDGFWWAVPKNRRTIERRLKRKYGSPYYEMKILQPKKHLRICSKCGHDFEVGVLCPHCYNRIKEETKAMQEAIQAKLGIDPVEKEVAVLYKDDVISGDSDEFYSNKRIVEMKKPRPQWFSQNLLQKSTKEPSTSKNVKPTQLG